MWKPRIYLDTSVISYLDQQDAPARMAETRLAWERIKQGMYEIFISDLVLEEMSRCEEEKLARLTAFLNMISYHVVEITDKVYDLAQVIIDFDILKEKSRDDCNHIAAALIADCDLILSWNFKHLVNIDTIKGVKVIATMEGYKDLLIYPPSVLLEEDRHEENN